MKDFDTLVIIPTYNEKENITHIAAAALDASAHVHLLFVDDNSPDGTGEIADSLAKSNNRIHVLHREKKEGLGRAYIAGFRWALERDYDFIMEMDADFSHDPKEIPNFRDKARKEADLVLGSRYLGGIRIINWPLNRLILSRGAGMYVQLLTGMPFTDPTGGFKCFRRELLESYNLDAVKSNGYGFQIEMTHKAWMKGYRVSEIPIIFEDRHAGTSKMSGNIIHEAVLLVIQLAARSGFRRKPRQERSFTVKAEA